MARIADFTLSLWVKHPTADLSQLPTKFGLRSVRQWLAGEPKTTHKGKSLEGVYRDSYCCMDVDVAAGMALSDCIGATLQRLEEHQSTIDTIVDTDGWMMLNVGWHSSFNTGEEFQPSLLAALGKMKITLGIDVYCDCEDAATVPL